VTVPDGAISGDIGGTVSALHELGYDSPARKYLAFADTTSGMGVACGKGEMYGDPSPTGNANDGAYSQIARTDVPCWFRSRSHGSSITHELVHMLGGVQPTAPHGAAAHCDDEADLMCYDDGISTPMREVCPAEEQDFLDCNDDDYFHTAPEPGSWLAQNWNVASSSFLEPVPALPDPPALSVTADRVEAEAGDPLVLTATTDVPADIAWESSSPDCLSGTTGATVTVLCPYYSVGEQTVTAYASTGNGVQVAASQTLTIAPSEGPIVETQLPFTVHPDEPFTFEPSISGGKMPYSYHWTNTSPECTVVGPTDAPTLTLTCPESMVGQFATAYLELTTADERLEGRTSAAKVQVKEQPEPAPTLDIALPETGTSGLALTASALRSGSFSGFPTWTAGSGCLVGDPHEETVTVHCPVHVTGPVSVTLTATTGQGEQLVASRTVTMSPPYSLTRLTASRDRAYVGDPVRLAGMVTQGETGAPLRARLRIEASTDRGATWATVLTDRTELDGAVSTTLRPARTTDYRLVVAGAPASTYRVSVARRPTAVTAALSRNPLRLSARLLDVTTSTVLVRKPVTVQVRWAGTRRWVRFTALRTDSRGRVTVRPRSGRSADYRVTFAGDAGHLPATSNRVRYRR
jgi:hypothetical protein